jgi:hypothetical protein
MATIYTTRHTIADQLGTAALLACRAFDNDQLDPEAAGELCVAAAAQLIEADELLLAQGMAWSDLA